MGSGSTIFAPVISPSFGFLSFKADNPGNYNYAPIADTTKSEYCGSGPIVVSFSCPAIERRSTAILIMYTINILVCSPAALHIITSALSSRAKLWSYGFYLHFETQRKRRWFLR